MMYIIPDQIEVKGEVYKLHHTALARGYISTKLDPLEDRCFPYNGRFGEGYTVESHSYKSSRYHDISYYVK